MRKHAKKVFTFFLLLSFILAIIVLLSFYSPTEIIQIIGVNNAYLIIFFVSFLGGFSALTSFSMVAVLVTFVSGGVNPLYLGIISGIGLAIGDIIMFITSSKGRELANPKWKKRFDDLAVYFEGRARKFIPFLTYIYMGLSPFPNDILIIFLAIIKYPLKKLYVPMILGDITYPLIISYLVYFGFL